MSECGLISAHAHARQAPWRRGTCGVKMGAVDPGTSGFSAPNLPCLRLARPGSRQKSYRRRPFSFIAFGQIKEDNDDAERIYLTESLAIGSDSAVATGRLSQIRAAQSSFASSFPAKLAGASSCAPRQFFSPLIEASTSAFRRSTS